MKALIALICLRSLAGAQTNCAPGWAQGEFPLAGVYGDVYVMTTFDDGSGPALFVGGWFGFAGNVPASNIAKWDGSSWSAVGSGLNGAVNAMVVHDEGSGPALYVGGNFSTAGGVSASRVARWDGSSWSAVGTVSVPPNAAVYALAVYDDGSGAKLIAGGTGGIASWNGLVWGALGSGVNGYVRSLAACNTPSGSRLYVAGNFTAAGSVQANKIACWDGMSWSNLGSGSTTGGSLTGFGWLSLATWNDGAGDNLYVGGEFTTIAGFPASYLARWNGSAWVPLPSPLPIATPVGALAALPTGSGTALHATIGCQPAKLTAAGWSLFPCGPGTVSGALTTFDQGSGPVVCVATNPGMVSRWTGSAWAPLGPGWNGAVDVVANLDDGTGPALYAGGRFSGAGGVPANRIVKRIGSSWTPLGTGVSGVGWPNGTSRVMALVSFDDGTGPGIYAGGNFTTAGGVAASNIARWNGSAWSALGPGLTGGQVQAMAVGDLGNGARLFVAGTFLAAGGLTVNGIAAWDGSSWSALGAGMSWGTTPPFLSVDTLAVHDDGSGPALYAGGSFTAAGYVPAPGMARWNGTAWSPVGANGGPTDTSALTIFDDGSGPALYASGSVGTAAAILKWTGTSWISIGTGLPGIAYALAGFNDGSGPALYAGVAYPPNSIPHLPGIYRWNGVSWSTPGGGFQGSIAGTAEPSPRVRSLVAADDGGGPALFAGGDFQWVDGHVSAGVAKWKAGGAPVVTVAPATQVVNPGAAASLTASATGAPGFGYQWRKNGVAISGAVGLTITVPATTPGDVATYDLVVTNPCGTTTSQPAYVIVRPAILSMTQPQGAGSLLVANTNGIPGASYFSSFTFDAANVSNPGNGSWLGLHIPYSDLVSQFVTQSPPFVGVLDANGRSTFTLPAGSLSPSVSGAHAFAVTAIYDPIALTVIGGSAIASLVLQ